MPATGRKKNIIQRKTEKFCMFVTGKENLDYLDRLSAALNISRARVVNTMIRYYRLNEGANVERFITALAETKAEQLAERRASKLDGNRFQPGTGRQAPRGQDHDQEDDQEEKKEG